MTLTSPALQVRPYSDATRCADPGPCLLVHLLADSLLWGLGFTQALEARWPRCAATIHQHKRHAALPVPLGEVLWTEVTEELTVAHLIAERAAGQAEARIDLPALARCLEQVAERALAVGATVHAPPLGTGLSGGHWPHIAELLHQYCVERGVPVVIHCLGSAPPL